MRCMKVRSAGFVLGSEWRLRFLKCNYNLHVNWHGLVLIGSRFESILLNCMNTDVLHVQYGIAWFVVIAIRWWQDDMHVLRVAVCGDREGYHTASRDVFFLDLFREFWLDRMDKYRRCNPVPDVILAGIIRIWSWLVGFCSV